MTLHTRTEPRTPIANTFRIGEERVCDCLVHATQHNTGTRFWVALPPPATPLTPHQATMYPKWSHLTILPSYTHTGVWVIDKRRRPAP
ncbi:hypothetical protein HBH64_232890 [Parastagonospora nodorum]|nr:hypothetical protein HBI10_193750 [Parastagonospora nodorum]KAH4153330.1 hypothetical protein HBH43_224550 [Parastagonospora nodorum]KAH4251337.1 hypothetical protein HBI03_225770 [Parastagonospora nodorum]KAH4285254.1 hypothetical protein HBI02_232370 [Parastagonospora nodorum]KAH4286214.1 hypothetical protein HBI01_240230 [Parastagonospora nodorum]